MVVLDVHTVGFDFLRCSRKLMSLVPIPSSNSGLEL